MDGLFQLASILYDQIIRYVFLIFLKESRGGGGSCFGLKEVALCVI